MAHKTTVVELVIEPTELYAIIQDWAARAKFSIYEKGENRTIYFRNFLAPTAWLSVEHSGRNARVEAWLSPKGVGPDFVGNIWKGWKIAIPEGYLFGPAAVCRKQWNELLRSLEAKSEKTPDKSSPALGQGNPLRAMKKSDFVKGLIVFGVVSLVSGILGVINTGRIMPSLTPNIEDTLFLKSAFDMFFGALILVSAWILSRSKALGLWLYAGAILLNILFGFAMGHKINYVVIGFSLLIMWQMFRSGTEWKLT